MCTGKQRQYITAAYLSPEDCRQAVIDLNFGPEFSLCASLSASRVMLKLALQAELLLLRLLTSNPAGQTKKSAAGVIGLSYCSLQRN